MPGETPGLAENGKFFLAIIALARYTVRKSVWGEEGNQDPQRCVGAEEEEPFPFP